MQNLKQLLWITGKVGNLKQKHPIVSHQQKSFYDFTGATYAKKKPTNTYLNLYYLTFVSSFMVVGYKTIRFQPYNLVFL